MPILNWLESIGLSRYAEALSEFPPEDILQFTDDDFKELGVLTPHRKKLLAALDQLRGSAESSTTDSTLLPASGSSALRHLIDHLPRVIALALREYDEESTPGMKLWAACDTVEMLLRFVVITRVADLRRLGDLEEATLKQLWGKIEMPTLGAWMSMAVSLVETGNAGELVVPEIEDFVADTLTPLLYGIEKSRTPETSFLALRNRLAHGGGLTRNEAQRLLGIWQDPFEAMLGQLQWLTQLHFVGLNACDAPIELMGVHEKPLRCEAIRRDQLVGDEDGVWLVRGEHTLMLWPMVLYGPARSETQADTAGVEFAAQVYARKDLIRLQFTPLGVEGVSQSEKGESAIDAFQSLFELDRHNMQKTTEGYRVQGFEAEIQRDAHQVVGRHNELTFLEKCVSERAHGVIWLSGVAGMGKSYLVAKLCERLSEIPAGSTTLCLPYRFKTGDDARCSRDAFADYIIERLCARGALIDKASIDAKGKAEERIKNCLDQVRSGIMIKLMLDGIDEISARDTDFVKAFPLSLSYANVVWFCAGRPENSLQAAFASRNAFMPYPDGLPAMRHEDVRAMILEKIGPLRKKLLVNDKEQDDKVINPFVATVEKRADGLPLYVKYVIGDILGNRYRVLDGHEDLPVSLHAYHQKLIDGLGLGDLKAILTPLAATLAVAKEPLSETELIEFLSLRNIVPDSEVGRRLVSDGLASLAPMLRRMPDPEGEEGFALFHASLREHILTTPTMAVNVATSREAFASLALGHKHQGRLENYLLRAGIDHLLDVNLTEEAKATLLDLDHFVKLIDSGKTFLAVLNYWLKIGEDNVGHLYVEQLKSYLIKYTGQCEPVLLEWITEFCAESGWVEAGITVAQMSLEFLRSTNAPPDQKALTVESKLGWLLSLKGETEAAHKHLEDAHRNLIDLLGARDRLTLKVGSDFGWVCWHSGQVERAEHLYIESYEGLEETLGKNHPDTLTSLNHLGWLQTKLGKLSKAADHLNQAYEGRLRVLGDRHPDVFISLKDLADLYEAEGAMDKSLSATRRSYDGMREILGENHFRTQEVHGLLLKRSAALDLARN